MLICWAVIFSAFSFFIEDAILKNTIEKDTSVFVKFESESYLVEDECKIDYFGNWSFN
ncbi:hypothetical protein HNP93_001415 [Methanococcus maripaludis]|nr:hypothetical protein [Methanococcus maripaludis]MBA2858714.1 hypothetical protein [Methanococcus maripaludis]